MTSSSRIADVAVRLASSLEPGEVCATAARAVGGALTSAGCCVYDFSPTHDLVTLQAAWSADDDPDAGQLVGAPFPLAGRPGLRDAIRERRTVETHVTIPDSRRRSATRCGATSRSWPRRSSFAAR